MKLKHYIQLAVMIFLTGTTASCDKAFPNDDLDYMWRMDSISFLKGVDFNGNECTGLKKGDVWYCIARDLVEIRSNNSPRGPIGVITEKEDSLNFDFTMYRSDDASKNNEMLWTLRSCGLQDYLTTYRIEELGSGKMVLSDSRARLFFTRW